MWHHVVATQGPGGMQLYVDDVLVGTDPRTGNQSYSGYWRLGGDNLGAWPNRPSTDYFTGSIDDAAIYDTVLSAAQVNTHYLASGRVLNDTTDPTVSITNPADGASVNVGPVTISADASDNVGVTSVEFFVDGGSVGVDATAPYSVVWTADAGPHTLTAVASDANGNTGSASAVNVTGVVPDTTDPTVSITSPADGAGLLAGAVPVTADASDNVGVTSVEFFVDGTSIGTDSTAPYAVTWTADGGGHTLTATASDAAGNVGTSASVGVTVTVPDTTDPTVSITNPADGASVNVGPVTISADASDNVGVTSVEFFVDGGSVGVDATAPYSVVWTADAGPHTLTAVASDANGNTGSASAVNVTGVVPDTTDPTVSITSPADGAGLLAGAVPVTADASDNVGVTSVEFFVDGTSIGTDSTAPYEVTWTADGGGHTLTATASDAAGNVGTSASVGVTVTVPDTTDPTVSITNPADGATLNAGSVSLTADASDNVGVTSVEFFVDGSSLGSDSTAPYSVSWTADEGPHVLTAVALDAAGNTGSASAVNVTVVVPDTTDPTVSITSPSSGPVVFGPVTIAATASDNVGVSSVEFFVDGTSIGTDSSAPFTRSWNATVEGPHVLTAVASDAVGNTGTSDAVNVTVPTDTDAPSVPTGLSASGITQTAVTLTWNASTDDRGVVDYVVRRDGGSPTTVTGTSVTIDRPHQRHVVRLRGAGEGRGRERQRRQQPADRHHGLVEPVLGQLGVGERLALGVRLDDQHVERHPRHAGRRRPDAVRRRRRRLRTGAADRGRGA